MTPQLSVVAAYIVFTVHHFCAAVRISVDGKEDDLAGEKSETGGGGASHDEGHTVTVGRKQSYLYVELVHGGSKGAGEGTTAMASIVRTALELFPQEPEPLDEHGRPSSFTPRVRLESAWGSDLFWTFMGMAPDQGILQDTNSELLVVQFARKFSDSGSLQRLMEKAFETDYSDVNDNKGGVDLGALPFPDPANASELDIPRKLLLAALWYVVRVGEPQGWAQDLDAKATQLGVTFPTQEELLADLNSYIADFRHARPHASVADVVASLGHYNYVKHEYVPKLLKTLRKKTTAKSGLTVKLEIGLNFHLSPEGRKRWTEAFQSAGVEITANPNLLEEGKTTELRADARDEAAAKAFESFHDLRHLYPWMSSQQQARAQHLAGELETRRVREQAAREVGQALANAMVTAPTTRTTTIEATPAAPTTRTTTGKPTTSMGVATTDRPAATAAAQTPAGSLETSIAAAIPETPTPIEPMATPSTPLPSPPVSAPGKGKGTRLPRSGATPCVGSAAPWLSVFALCGHVAYGAANPAQ